METLLAPRGLYIVGLLAALALPGHVHAQQNCTVRGINESGFVNQCTDAQRVPVSGEAYPTFGDALNLNPASIPVHSTPLGVECIGSAKDSQISGANWNVALIRGFSRFGTALSTSADNTFYSSPYLQATSDASAFAVPAPLVVPTMSFGLATDALFKAASFLKPVAGAALRYNQTRGTFGYSSGVSLGLGRSLSLGGSFIHEPTGNSLPGEQSVHLMASFSTARLQADLTYALNRILSSSGNTFEDGLHPSMAIVTVSANVGKLGGTLGYKRFLDSFATSVTQLWLVSASVELGKRIRLAYLYDYVPGAHSLGAQILFL